MYLYYNSLSLVFVNFIYYVFIIFEKINGESIGNDYNQAIIFEIEQVFSLFYRISTIRNERFLSLS